MCLVCSGACRKRCDHINEQGKCTKASRCATQDMCWPVKPHYCMCICPLNRCPCLEKVLWPW